MNIIRISTIVLLGMAAAGCGPRYGGLAAHTLDAGENNQLDIVWVVEDGERVMRCQNSKTGPVCTTAQMQ